LHELIRFGALADAREFLAQPPNDHSQDNKRVGYW
jgi:hypothetical protein